MIKGFDNYLSMVSQLYYGLPIPQNFVGKTAKLEGQISGSQGGFYRK
jgi:hypothetical protein